MEPAEAAWEILEEALEPFMDEMKRYLGLGLHEQALETCKGIVLGLYEARDCTADEFLGWASDFPAEAAGGAVASWISGAGPKAAEATGQRLVFEDFIQNHAAEWREMLGRVLRKEES